MTRPRLLLHSRELRAYRLGVLVPDSGAVGAPPPRTRRQPTRLAACEALGVRRLANLSA